MMYIKIAIYRQASMNIRIDVGQQQNWWWWGWGGGGGVHKAKIFLLHFSLNHSILSRMALFLEKLEFFLFSDPLPPYWKIPTFFFEPFPKPNQVILTSITHDECLRGEKEWHVLQRHVRLGSDYAKDRQAQKHTVKSC